MERTMKRIAYLAFVFTLFLLVTGSTTAAADKVDLLDRHFEAVGGIDRLFKIKTITRSGNATMGGAFGDLAGTIEEAVVVGSKSYSEMDLGVHRESTGWNGTAGWKKTLATGTVTLSGTALEGAKAAAFPDPLQDLFDLYGAEAFIEGDDGVVRGQDCDTLWIVDTDIAFYLDKATHHLLAMETSISDPALGDARLAIYYSDHSEYEGVWLPDRTELNIADGTITIGLEYTQTEIDVPVDEAVFEKPE
jgi:hypothetical protein